MMIEFPIKPYVARPFVNNLISDFISPTYDGKRYLFGRNIYSKIISEKINIAAFIDDFAVGTEWHNKPVLKGDDVPSDSIVVNCVLNSKPRMAHNRILQFHCDKKVLLYADLCNNLKSFIPVPSFSLSTEVLPIRQDLIVNEQKWNALWFALGDPLSKQTLSDVISFRLTADYQLLSDYQYRPHDQYFEDFVPNIGPEVFVDAGGYEGETTQIMCNNNPNYKKVFIFEPSPLNIKQAKARLEGLRDIEFIEQGVSDRSGTLFFNPNVGSSCAVGKNGSLAISVTTLDECIPGGITFIKMDLEGWEINALKGAKRHILDDHPKLAIAVYHNPSDFWQIYHYVISLRCDYNVYLRHYSEGWAETVMYFVPK